VIGDPCCRDLVPLKPAQERVPAGWEREVPLTGCETLLAMSGAAGPSREQARRALTEREQTFKDREEDFVHAKAAAATKEERRALSQDFGEYRRRHREENVAAGRRAADGGIRMHQIMWARWAEVAVEHELDARGAFAAIVANPEEGSLLKDFRASLVAITGAAYAIEAVYGDIKYLIPEQPRRDSRELNLWHAFNQAFGIPASASHRLLPDIRWLFALRDHAAHPYTEAEPPQEHPAGVNTGAETSLFNAVTSGRAVDLMFEVFGYAAAPPAPFNTVGSSVGSRSVVPTTRPPLPPLSPCVPKSRSTCRRCQSRSCLRQAQVARPRPGRTTPQKRDRGG
jgi:hypothetical protein